MKKNMRRLLGTAALLLAMMLVLTACGSKDAGDSGSSADFGTAEPAPAPAEETQEPADGAAAPEDSEPASEETSDEEETPQPVVSGDGIEGVWVLTGISNAGDEDQQYFDTMLSAGVNMEYSFSGGRIIISGNPDGGESTLSGVYVADGSKLMVTPDGGKATDPMEYKIDGDTMEVTTQKLTMLFTRRK